MNESLCIRLASNKMNLSNQEETHQFKFLVVLSIVVKEAPHAFITAIKLRKKWSKTELKS
ncbi:MAG: hypothetical protein MUP48_01715 [Wolbachia endosymbiont of Homalodisca vitripennis]|nr:hypothetical protein [Wolbachia endosymbiont of Homalodisca vitripennis]MCJ7454160.1 hypothetical protein [Wolbachia endosymbiont of Homalodisca vitripennis]MCJ7475866.1 hypothetical protein [Wolbachia endosymbiont of Homalodisca vitripennis]